MSKKKQETEICDVCGEEYHPDNLIDGICQSCLDEGFDEELDEEDFDDDAEDELI